MASTNLMMKLQADLIDVTKGILIKTMPRTFFDLQMRNKTHEPELQLVSRLLPKGGVAIDIGANEGLWVYHLQQLASRVLAFEPVDHLASRLERKSDENVEVVRYALSNVIGTAELRYPRRQRAWGTIERANRLDRSDREIQVQPVEIRTLDSFALDKVDLIKIDVEGHELSVIEGAMDTLARCRPNLVVEIENDHKPGAVSAVAALLAQAGYDGFFLDGDLRPICEFDGDRDQNRANVGAFGKSGRYINNFVFMR